MTSIEPTCAHFTEGEPFDFGTHANDFLLKREDSLATETFLVRVPGRGSVPAHTHTDMEQTFVFISGCGTAVLTKDEKTRTYQCGPGTVVFVPTGWEHSVIAESPEGVRYVTVDAFIPGIERIGQTATGHAEAVADNFPEPTLRGRLSSTEIFRTAENSYSFHSGAWVPNDFGSLESTARRLPSRYRVERVGPFEIVRSVAPTHAQFTIAHADAVFNAVDAEVGLFVEGSQSPLSVKSPYKDSDIDLLIAVPDRDGLASAQHARDAIEKVCAELSAPISIGIVLDSWLTLPGFYSAVSLNPESGDRRWWSATESERITEAETRLRRGLDLLEDPEAVKEVFRASLAAQGLSAETVLEWRISPRWQSLTAPERTDVAR
jgi:mannose-6-phosphate isomerase-like protein (cupin superfamily)